MRHDAERVVNIVLKRGLVQRDRHLKTSKRRSLHPACEMYGVCHGKLESTQL